MKYIACLVGGFILGSSSLWAQSPFLDFGATRLEDRAVIQQWWVEKELRAGRNPFGSSPQVPNPCN